MSFLWLNSTRSFSNVWKIWVRNCHNIWDCYAFFLTIIDLILLSIVTLLTTRLERYRFLKRERSHLRKNKQKTKCNGHRDLLWRVIPVLPRQKCSLQNKFKKPQQNLRARGFTHAFIIQVSAASNEDRSLGSELTATLLLLASLS